MLSAVSQQVQTIQEALKSQQEDGSIVNIYLGGKEVCVSGNFYHHESRLRWSRKPTGQLEETLPFYGHDVTRSSADCRSDAFLSRIQNGQEAGQENSALLQNVRRATVEPVPLRFRSSCSEVRAGVFW